ncbi:MAG: binding-protein-dependent transport system inner rane component [Lachnospiraceae bacterium]|jgi:multiple sugar transport system permease protein|nr:binding-protein-dependent transport system inner rane component [Lachnospiraceae bacterium]
MSKTENNNIQRIRKPLLQKKDIVGWMIMLPTIALFAFFVWEPLLESVNLSMHDAKGFRLEKFVGFDNYIELFQYPIFMKSLVNTVVYIIWSLIIGFFTPMILAILITETVHFKSFFRIGVYFPNMIPGLATVLMWRYLFLPGDSGVFNIILSKIGIEPLQWLNNTNLTIPLIIVIMTWRGAGATALIYMANIGNIDPVLYEAATIDGAGIFKRIRYITFPSVFSLGKTLLIIQIIAVFQILYEPLVLKQGGPNNASVSIMMVVWNYANRNFDYPMAAATSVVICIILIILSGLYFKFTKNKED